MKTTESEYVTNGSTHVAYNISWRSFNTKKSRLRIPKESPGVGNPLKGLYKEGERYLLALSYLKPSGSHKQNIAKIKGQSRCTVIWVLNDRMYCNVITTDEHM